MVIHFYVSKYFVALVFSFLVDRKMMAFSFVGVNVGLKQWFSESGKTGRMISLGFICSM